MKREWERFYTDSKQHPELVDQVEIDAERKTYRLFIDADDHITDGIDEHGEPIYSCYVSRLVFESIVKGLREAWGSL